MGWFWGSSDDKGSSSSQDPLRNLDPSLRDFLAKESPVKYSTTTPQTPEAVATPAQPAAKVPQTAQSQPGNDAEPKVPKESLYQDGRYADLWKTYVPQKQVEAAMKSESEKVNDVIEAFKERKARIGIAAMENCVLEQIDVEECFQNGGWHARLTMCKDEKRKVDRCFTMQGKFLRALGYLSTYDRSPQEEERIQMHADTLYHRMLEQEKEIEAAKAEGKPIPQFPPLLSRSKPAADGLQMSAKSQAQLKERLRSMKPEERELEEAAAKAELDSGREIAGSLGKIYQQQDEERRQRREAGSETIGDRIISIIRWF
ncbi:putative autophagy protein [Coleophoma cylindrospora]|uniref:Putative autophagy protein n=1 Tax=Coleophoma cylindrospora TaxID=1849047 RepID=A0A3D8RHB7_9HELO|nr:putative autophagy protein [Coleophoma cylindrospora]